MLCARRAAVLAGMLALAATLACGQTLPRVPEKLVWQIRQAEDRGAAPADLPLQHMLLLLRRSAAQQAALQALLQAQQQPGNPEFHHWLTPQQFGERFGPPPPDIARVKQWLQAGGLQVENVAAGGLTIEFSGTAAGVQQAFHTAVHRYQAGAGLFWANASSPVIPAALASVVAGVVSLNNFESRPVQQVLSHGFSYRPAAGQAAPELNFPYDGGTQRAMVPGDFDTIYNVPPSLNGAGETIAIAARSDIDPQDLVDFRSLFQPGAPINVLTTMQATSTDPGIATNGDEDEATLDTEWAGAAAPDAKLDLVVAASTATTDGVDLAAQYIVDHDLAPILNTSFSQCESAMGATENQFWNNLWQQAAAEGITVLVSAGDDGPAACDAPSASVASGGLAVSGLASTPYDTAVGGTMFDEGSNEGEYWSPASHNDYSSALQYIPELPWDEVGQASTGGGIWSGSGGASVLYTRPAWQVAPGVPAGGSGAMRLVPDLALSAAAHDGYVVCFQESCSSSPSQGFEFYVFSGTSAAAPAFAGLMALVDQSQNQAQGLVNPTLYGLAAQQPQGACYSSAPPISSCTFNDVTQGNNFVPCTAGSAGCGANGEMGFSAAPGYDEATGLGSVNASNLAANWSKAGLALSHTTLSLSLAANASFGESLPVAVAVAGSGSSAPVPTGTVELIKLSSNGANQPLQTLTLDASGGYSASLTDLPVGSYSVIAYYSGDSHYGPSSSTATAVTIAKATPTVTLDIYTTSPNQPLTTAIYGARVTETVVAAGPPGAAAAPTGTVTITDNQPGGEAPVVGSPETLGSNASVSTAQILQASAGTNTLAASYSGDGNYAAAQSAALAIQVSPSPTSLVFSQSGTGTEISLDTESATSPDLPVVVYNGATSLGPAQLFSSSTDATTSFTDLLYVFTVPVLPGTSVSLTAKFAGNQNYLASTSNTLAVPTPVNVSASPAALSFAPLDYGQSSAPQTVIFTNNGGEAAGGLVFTGPDYELASTTCGASLASGASCSAAVVFHPLSSAPPAAAVSDVSLGNANVPLNGAVHTLTLTGNFFITAVGPGQPAIIPLTVTAYGGFQGPVTFTCSGLPANAACSFNPSSVALTGDNAVNVTLTITTAVAAAASAGGGSGPADAAGLLVLLGLAALAVFPRRRRRSALAAAGCALLVLLLAAGCGGGSGGASTSTGGSGTGGNSGPPPPQVTLTPSALNFGGVIVGDQVSESLTVNFSTEAQFNAVSSIAFSSGQAGDFTQTNTCISAMAPMMSCAITVTFAPASAGAASSQMLIADNGAGSPQTVALNGSGVTGVPAGNYPFTVSASSGGASSSLVLGLTVGGTAAH
ncbi:MAG: protease pro-enzyme activation domain-containing protein [Terriglobales bacterium]